MTLTTYAARRTRRLALAPLMALLLLPAMMQSCGGPTLRGNVYPNVWCQPSGEGIYFTAVTTGFVPNIQFEYEFWVYKDGLLQWHDVSGLYWTDAQGNHNGMSRHWLDCGHGVYRVEMIARDVPGNNETYFSTDEVAC